MPSHSTLPASLAQFYWTAYVAYLRQSSGAA